MISPKEWFVNRVIELMCRNCSRKLRIERRLREEIGEYEFDHDRHEKVDKILKEE